MRYLILLILLILLAAGCAYVSGSCTLVAEAGERYISCEDGRIIIITPKVLENLPQN